MAAWMPEPQSRFTVKRRHLDRDARLQPDMARAEHRIRARLQHVAEDDVIDLRRRDSRARKRRARCQRAKIERRDVFELAGVFGHRRPRAAEDVDLLTHSISPHCLVLGSWFTIRGSSIARGHGRVQISLSRSTDSSNGRPRPSNVIANCERRRLRESVLRTHEPPR